MKFYGYLILAGTAAGLTLYGCAQEEELLINTGEELTLTASAKEIILTEAKESEEALKLTWTPANSYGLEKNLYYTIDIAKADSDYEDGYRRDMGKSTFSISWTQTELNTFLKKEFSAEAGIKSDYKARITATVYGRNDLTQTAETEFSATAYIQSTSTLYIAGTSLVNQTEGQMTRTGTGQFTWTGALDPGEITFAVSTDSEWPCYGIGEEEGKLKYYEDDPGSDITIKIQSPGEYTVTTDLYALAYSVEYSSVPVPDVVYITGSAANSSSYTDAIEMQSHESGVFTFNDMVDNGTSFRFITSKNDWWPGYVRDKDSSDGLGVRYFSSDPGNEYSLDFNYTGESGWKLITLNVNNMTVSIEDGQAIPATLCIGGTALDSKNPWPWPRSGNMFMQRTETGYEWTGDLLRGMFRFSPGWAQSTWPAYLRNGESVNYWTSTQLVDFAQDRPYLGFYVLDAGKYHLTFNLNSFEVTLECLEKHPENNVYEENLYILFDHPVWEPFNSIQMVREEAGHFYWEGEITADQLNPDNYKDKGVFVILAQQDWWPKRYGKIISNDPDMKGKLGYYESDPVTNFDAQDIQGGPGKYRIEVDLTTMSIKIQKL